MRKFILSLSCFLPLLISAQPKLDLVKLDTAMLNLRYTTSRSPYYFIDSVLVDINKCYFDYNNVKSIKVVKDTIIFYATEIVNKIYLTRQSPNKKWVMLNDIKLNDSTCQPTSSKTFIIDGVVIIDTAKVLIDPTFIDSIDILQTQNLPEFHEVSKITVLVITNRQRKNKLSLL